MHTSIQEQEQEWNQQTWDLSITGELTVLPRGRVHKSIHLIYTCLVKCSWLIHHHLNIHTVLFFFPPHICHSRAHAVRTWLAKSWHISISQWPLKLTPQTNSAAAVQLKTEHISSRCERRRKTEGRTRPAEKKVKSKLALMWHRANVSCGISVSSNSLASSKTLKTDVSLPQCT